MSVLHIDNTYNKLVISDGPVLSIPAQKVRILSVGTQGTPGVNADLQLEVPVIDGESSGFSTSEFEANYTTSIGDLVYLKDTTTWDKCDANDVTTCNGLLGIAMEVKNQGDKVLVALPGSFISSSAFPSLIIGSPVYIGENVAEITTVIPSTSGVVIRVIGWGVAADKLYFYPSPDYITRI